MVRETKDNHAENHSHSPILIIGCLIVNKIGMMPIGYKTAVFTCKIGLIRNVTLS